MMLTNGDWDDHKELDKRHEKNCRIVDRPTAALIRDLKQRGLLESTLVIWASEFGRTPMAQMDRQDEDPGRDHHPDCFSMWLAGGGTAGGRIVGKTDDIGLKPVEGKVHVHDLQATVLHCLGLDHEKLTYKHQGRDFRLTDVGGRVVNPDPVVVPPYRAARVAGSAPLMLDDASRRRAPPWTRRAARTAAIGRCG